VWEGLAFNAQCEKVLEGSSELVEIVIIHTKKVQVDFRFTYMGYYNPRTGRFTQQDPIYDGLNWYTYAANNPIRYKDPSGLAIDDGNGGLWFYQGKTPDNKSVYTSTTNKTIVGTQTFDSNSSESKSAADVASKDYSGNPDGSGDPYWPAYDDLTEEKRNAYNNYIYYFKPDSLWPVGGDGWTNYNNWPNYNSYSGGSAHGGNDIAAPEGTNIYSVYYGTASTIPEYDAKNKQNPSGNHVIVTSIINNIGVSIYYKHMSNFAIGNNVGVAPGQTIGYVGHTGNTSRNIESGGTSTGNHLHFQVNNNGKPGDDPFEYLPNAPKK